MNFSATTTTVLDLVISSITTDHHPIRAIGLGRSIVVIEAGRGSGVEQVIY